MKLITERLIIRNLLASDLEDSFEHRSDPEVSRYVGKPITRAQAIERIEQAQLPWDGKEHSKLFLAIELKSEKKLIGELMFKNTNIESQIGEIGYRLNKNYQDKGYAFEATNCLNNYLFRELGLHKITAFCAAENKASWQLMEKLGMQREGILKSHFKLGEGWSDAFMYGLLAS